MSATIRRLVPFLLLAALAAGCACPTKTAPVAGSARDGRDLAGLAPGGPSPYESFLKATPGEEWVRTELFFGMSRASEPLITEKEWGEFLDGTVTPLFPDGLTVLDGHGQWRSPSGTFFNEPSKVLVIMHPPDPAINAKLEQLRKTWKERFRQESVLRVTSPAKADF